MSFIDNKIMDELRSLKLGVLYSFYLIYNIRVFIKDTTVKIANLKLVDLVPRQASYDDIKTIQFYIIRTYIIIFRK